jgi:hypothetical protein
MAVVLVILFATAMLAGVIAGIFFTISFAIRREDRAHSLRWDAPDPASRSARLVVGRPVYGDRAAEDADRPAWAAQWRDDPASSDDPPRWRDG